MANRNDKPNELMDRHRSSRIGRTVLVVLLAVMPLAVALSSSSTAVASETPPPVFEKEPLEEAIYATRAHLVEEVLTGEVELSWVAEYVEAENGHPGTKWIKAGEGHTCACGDFGKFPYVASTYLGTVPDENQTPLSILHGLKPETKYYARFRARNPGEAETKPPFEFTTHAVEKPEIGSFVAGFTGPKSAVATSEIENNGAPLGTEYHFEFAPAENSQAPPEVSASWKPFTAGSASGNITLASDFATLEADVTGLTPETEYFARVRASNEKGPAVKIGSFTTPPAAPVVFPLEVRNVTGTSAHMVGDFLPHGTETHWRVEYAPASTGPWNVVLDAKGIGAEGVLAQAKAEAFPEGLGFFVDASLAGLSPKTTYYTRLFAENAAGEGKVCDSEAGRTACETISGATREIVSFETFGAPSATTFAVHGLHGEALRVMGSVNPNNVPTSGEQTVTLENATGGTFTLTFKGKTTVPIAFDASQEEVSRALGSLAATNVAGPDGGPYTVYFTGPAGGVAQPAITADASGLTPSGPAKVTVATVAQGGEAYTTHYRFEYVSRKQFEAPGGEGGFAKAVSTPSAEVAPAGQPQYFGVDLPGLSAGETYRFRISATSTAPGDPVVNGEPQALTVPAPPVSAPEDPGACPNSALRRGPSADLPDCRAYEQLTPTDKGGAQEIFNYGGNFGREGALTGENNDQLEYGSVAVKWGTQSSAGQSPYFFSRGEHGWKITAAGAQPQAGVFRYTPQLLAGNFNSFAFESRWATAPSHESLHVEFNVGPPGGPYATAASVPSGESQPGWVAASKDFSKLVLEVPDHVLSGRPTGTVTGDDLYEYAGGTLRQANVTGGIPGVTLGKCGATIAGGVEHGGEASANNRHAVSSDGSRVFFEAAPGNDCSETKHVYVRIVRGATAQTVDLGAYRFVAADPSGGKALLEKPGGERLGLYLYDDRTAKAAFLPGSDVAVGAPTLTVSDDLSAVYIVAGEPRAPTLYRYGVSAGRLLFVTQLGIGGNGRRAYSSSPDGRYFYFIAETVAGLPGGGEELRTPHAARYGPTSQVYRYDSAEALVQCMSCASPFDPEPKLSALFNQGASGTSASENGDFVFFDTPAALVSSDVDGEIAPEGPKSSGGEHGSIDYSLSSDVYEWRRDGIDGCHAMQGCVALITSGGGGFLNILLGTDGAGSNVYFATNEALVKTDNDTAGDIYTARIDGGFAEPSPPVQCEGDACSAPFAAPSDQTPSSATFQGAGNAQGAIPPKATQRLKGKHKRRCSAKPGKKKCKAAPKKVSKRGGRTKRSVRFSHTSGRTGQ